MGPPAGTADPGQPERRFQVLSPTIKLSSPETREFWEIPVLFEDEHLLALDKPAGLLCSPHRDDPSRPSLMSLLHQGITEAKPWAVQRGLAYLVNAHRLDAEASGVLLLARNKPALVALANVFGSEKPSRQYVTLAQGEPAGDSFEIDTPLGAQPTEAGFVRADPRRGKRSRTRVTVLERFVGWTLLRCEPLTDRFHQVRAHLRSAGLPMAGDSLYGGRPLLLSRLKQDFRLKPGRTERPLIGSPLQHSAAVAVPHPVTGAPLEITAPWPRDLAVALKYLRRYAPSSNL